MTTFDSLPLELKQTILERAGNYDITTKVSKEWRRLIRSSKKILQKEIDKYFFFYVIWYPSWHPLWPNRWQSTLFLFPIVTEEQFVFLRKRETRHSQVGALEKTNGINNLFWSSSERYDCFFLSDRLTQKQIEKQNEFNITIGNTTSLVQRLTSTLKKQTTAIIDRYIQDVLIPTPEDPQRDYAVFDDLPEPDLMMTGPQFSDKETMLEVLRGEHKLISDFGAPSSIGPPYFYVCEPSDYKRLEIYLKQAKEAAEDDELLERLEESYFTLSKSLFKPRWRGLRKMHRKPLFGTTIPF